VNELLLVIGDVFGLMWAEVIFLSCLYLQTVTFMQLCSNGLGTMRDLQWRYTVTRPASVWLLTQISWFAFAFTLRKILVGRPEASKGSMIKRVLHVLTLTMPLCLCILGLFHTITPIEINNSVTFKSNIVANSPKEGFELKLFQLTDIHLGTFMSDKQLHNIVHDTLERHPDLDLVLLTGDFYTVESSREKKALSNGLRSLKTFAESKSHPVGWACPGNHDHDVQEMAREELESVHVNYLVDEQRVVEIRGEKVQIVGLDYRFRKSVESLSRIYQDLASKAVGISARIVLLHNPSHFKYIVPVDTVPTLILSGHLHGGQFGVRSFPLISSDWTVLRLFSMPDFGFYFQNANGQAIKFEEQSQLKHMELDVDIVTNMTQVQYVHSGTGFYGLPLRVGTQSERGVMTMRIEPTETQRR